MTCTRTSTLAWAALVSITLAACSGGDSAPDGSVDAADAEVADGSGEDTRVDVDSGNDIDDAAGDPDEPGGDVDTGEDAVESDAIAPDVAAPDTAAPDAVAPDVIDPDAPSLAIEFTSPADGAYARGVVTVTAAPSGEIGGVGVMFFVDGAPIAERWAAPYTFDWNTDEFDEGVHAIEATAIGSDDRSATSRIAVTVDRTPPEVTVDAPVGGTYETVVDLAATATDNFSVGRVEWYLLDEDFRLEIDGESGEVVYLEGNLVATFEASPFGGVLDGSDLPSGEWEVVALAYDRVGLADLDTGSFWLGRAPTVEFASPADGATVHGPGVVHVTVRSDSTRVRTTLHVDGTEVDSRLHFVAPGIDEEVVLDWVPEYERANRALRVDVVDGSGRAASDAITVLVDHPFELAVDLCDPLCAPLAGGEMVADTVTVGARPRDDDGAPTRVEFFIDGALATAVTAAPWTWEWDTAAMLDGSRVVRVVATSSNGSSAERSYELWVNNCDRDDDRHASLACGGPDCDDADPTFVSHACGSCAPLGAVEGDPCGVCNSGEQACSGRELVCVGDRGEAARNACGGCAVLASAPGASCGPCGLDAWECRADAEAVLCSGTTRNACGGCAELPGAPSAPCDTCGESDCRWACWEPDELSCDPTLRVADWFVLVPAGTFVMGSPPDEVGRTDRETQHTVTLTRSFYLQTTEVTQRQWRAMMPVNPSSSSCPDCPVDTINWWEAAAYANALSASEGLPECYSLHTCWSTPGADMECSSISVTGAGGNPYDCAGYRLPTEAEWEYAARASTTTATYAGNLAATDCSDTTLPPIAWFCGNSSGGVRSVGQRAANDWGLYDMLGSVFEWTWDGLRTYADSVTDPFDVDWVGFRVIRGGSLDSFALMARAAYRGGSHRGNRTHSVGFRLARTAP